jgi:hypothetical protein
MQPKMKGPGAQRNLGPDLVHYGLGVVNLPTTWSGGGQIHHAMS